MRYVTKRLLGTAAFFVAAGLALALAGWAMGAKTSLSLNWNDGRVEMAAVGGGARDSLEARNLEAFDSIDITSAIADISFQAAEDYGVELVWYGERLEMEYQVEGDQLIVWNSHNSFNMMNSPKTGQVVVYLPEDAVLDTVFIQADMGQVRISGWEMEDLTIENDMGEIHLSGQTVDMLNASSSMGKIELDGVSARAMDLSSDMGSVVARDCTVTDALSAESNMGNIELSGALTGALDLVNDMGGIKMSTTAPVTQFSYDLSVDMGALTVDGRKYREHAEREGGPHSLSARADMGSVEISFSSGR